MWLRAKQRHDQKTLQVIPPVRAPNLVGSHAREIASYGQQVDVQVSPNRLKHTLATRLINQWMPIHSLRKLLGHQRLNTPQIYACIYDETLYEQFKDAMSRLESVAENEWPHVKAREQLPVEAEV